MRRAFYRHDAENSSVTSNFIGRQKLCHHSTRVLRDYHTHWKPWPIEDDHPIGRTRDMSHIPKFLDGGWGLKAGASKRFSLATPKTKKARSITSGL
jgi:hypothetical protein